jgi:hypothetical protein
MKIILEKTEAETIFYDSLCNGMDYISGYGLQLDYSVKDYTNAKKELVKEGKEGSICREDVWMKILKMGGKLKFIDDENEGEYTRSITMEDVYENINLVDAQTILDVLNENGDAGHADIIIQTVFYKEVIFG